MSPTARALLGASLGALVTLCLHPASRPFMMGIASRTSTEELRQCLDANAPALASPTTLPEAGLWMQLAAARIVKADKLTAKELETLQQIAQIAETKDPTNAFWPQMEAVFFLEKNQLPQVLNAWTRASACSKWDDFQTNRLLQSRKNISDITGVQQSWQLAYVYYSRSEDVSTCIRSVARTILSKADYGTADGVTLRYITLLNADLIRTRARSLNSFNNATEIVDLVTYPADTLSPTAGTSISPKKLHIGEDKVISNLITVAHQPDWSQRAAKIFSQSESMRALTIHDSNQMETDLYTVGAIVCSSVASASVIVAALGLMIWTSGALVAWRLSRAKEIKPYVAAVVAIVFGGFVDFITKDLSAGFAAALCAAFLTVAPDRSRKVRPNDLGPLFTFVSVILAIFCSLLFTTYLIGTTPAANAILPNLGISSEYIDRPVLAGMSIVSFGLVLLMAPIWAVVHRLGTPHVLSLSLKKFGAFIAVTGLSLSIVLGPLSVYADQRIESTFTELVKNEPVHFYVHR